MIQSFSELSLYLAKTPTAACFADTTVLFSFSHTLDRFNEFSEKALTPLYKSEIPICTNVIVRAEFLELQRRALIPECLIDFYQDYSSVLPGPLAAKLLSHQTSYRKKLDQEKSPKLDSNQIKSFRLLLSELSSPAGNGWELLCRAYLQGKLEPLWDALVKRLNIEFLSLRATDSNPRLESVPQWEDAVSLMGRYGIASSDAMILNMFLCSKISVLLTADLEMAEVAEKESNGQKQIFIPDSLLK